MEQILRELNIARPKGAQEKKIQKISRKNFCDFPCDNKTSVPQATGSFIRKWWWMPTTNVLHEASREEEYIKTVADWARQYCAPDMFSTVDDRITAPRPAHHCDSNSNNFRDTVASVSIALCCVVGLKVHMVARGGYSESTSPSKRPETITKEFHGQLGSFCSLSQLATLLGLSTHRLFPAAGHFGIVEGNGTGAAECRSRVGQVGNACPQKCLYSFYGPRCPIAA